MAAAAWSVGWLWASLPTDCVSPIHCTFTTQRSITRTSTSQAKCRPSAQRAPTAAGLTKRALPTRPTAAVRANPAASSPLPQVNSPVQLYCTRGLPGKCCTACEPRVQARGGVPAGLPRRHPTSSPLPAFPFTTPPIR